MESMTYCIVFSPAVRFWSFGRDALCTVCFHPLACVDEGFNPRSYIVGAYAVGGVVAALPGEDGTFGMGHDGQMTSVGAGDGCYVVARTVGVSGISGAVELGHDVVFLFVERQAELAFAVGYPCSDFASCQTSEHDAMVFGDGQAHECAFELVAVVVEHLCVVACIGDGMVVAEQTKFYHQLATVADTEAQGIRASIEAVEGGLSLGIEEEGSGPSLGTAEDIAVGESSAECDDVDVVEGLAAADEVGHGDVFHVESCEPEGVGHLAFGVGSLFADDGSADATFRLTVRVKPPLCELSGEVGVETDIERLLAEVVAPFFGFAVERLPAVEEE